MARLPLSFRLYVEVGGSFEIFPCHDIAVTARTPQSAGSMAIQSFLQLENRLRDWDLGIAQNILNIAESIRDDIRTILLSSPASQADPDLTLSAKGSILLIEIYAALKHAVSPQDFDLFVDIESANLFNLGIQGLFS